MSNETIVKFGSLDHVYEGTTHLTFNVALNGSESGHEVIKFFIQLEACDILQDMHTRPHTLRACDILRSYCLHFQVHIH